MKNNQHLKTLCDIFNKNGFDLYLVGGAVRDELLGKNVYDYDICSSASPSQVKILLENSNFIINEASAKFGTLIIAYKSNFKCEHTTFREDSYNRDGSHGPNLITFTNSLQTDANRRDFTINAIYKNVATGELIDYFNGQSDLKRKLLKTIKSAKETFIEDSLRIFRLVRFSSFLNFKIERKTYSAAKSLSKLIAALSIERIKSELNKILIENENLPLSIKNLNNLKISRTLIGKNLKLPKYFILQFYKLSNFEKKLILCNVNNLLIEYLAENLKEQKLLISICDLYKEIEFENHLQLNKELKFKLMTSPEALSYLPNLYNKNNKIKYDYLISLQNKIEIYNLPVDIKHINISGNDLINLGLKKEQIGISLLQIHKQILLSGLPNNKTDIINFLQRREKDDC